MAPESMAGSSAQQGGRTLAHFRQAEELAKEANDSAKKNWIPRIQLSGGPKIARREETHYGYVAGISLNLPAFSRGQEGKARALVPSANVGAESKAALRSRVLAFERARLRLSFTREELPAFDAGVQPHVTRLQVAAESGCREACRSIVELLGSQNTANAVQKRRLVLVLAAKLAELEYRAAQGEFE